MTEPRIAVVGIPGKWSTERLADAVERRTGYRRVVDMAEVELDLSSNRLLHQGVDLCSLDALMVKKISSEYSPSTLDRLELLRVAQAQGVRVFSDAQRILRLVDRLSCTVTLRNAGIPMPDTRVTECPETALATVKAFGEAVFKPLFSTKARGMCLINSRRSDADILAAITDFQRHNPVLYIQRKLDLSGRDLGMVFLGGRYLGTYARVSRQNTWNTTINSGGHYEAFEPASELIDLARRAQAPFGLDFTTVDVALTANGPIVFEVSAFGGFRGALEGAGIDAAALYTDYVLGHLTS